MITRRRPDVRQTKSYQNMTRKQCPKAKITNHPSTCSLLLRCKQRLQPIYRLTLRIHTTRSENIQQRTSVKHVPLHASLLKLSRRKKRDKIKKIYFKKSKKSAELSSKNLSYHLNTAPLMPLPGLSRVIHSLLTYVLTVTLDRPMDK